MFLFCFVFYQLSEVRVAGPEYRWKFLLVPGGHKPMFETQGIVKSLHQSSPRLVTTVNWNYIKKDSKSSNSGKGVGGRDVAGGSG